MVLVDREGLPISPWADCVAHEQAPCLEIARPAQWGRPCYDHQVNRAQVEWAVQATPAAVLIALAEANEVPNFEVTLASSTRFSARFFTPMLQWLDVVDVELMPNGADATIINARSASTGICPASCPGACCCSALCCCIPFEDHGKNIKHLNELKAHMEAKGVRVTSENIIVRGYARAPPTESMERSEPLM